MAIKHFGTIFSICVLGKIKALKTYIDAKDGPETEVDSGSTLNECVSSNIDPTN